MVLKFVIFDTESKDLIYQSCNYDIIETLINDLGKYMYKEHHPAVFFTRIINLENSTDDNRYIDIYSHGYIDLSTIENAIHKLLDEYNINEIKDTRRDMYEKIIDTTLDYIHTVKFSYTRGDKSHEVLNRLKECIVFNFYENIENIINTMLDNKKKLYNLHEYIYSQLGHKEKLMKYLKDNKNLSFGEYKKVKECINKFYETLNEIYEYSKFMKGDE